MTSPRLSYHWKWEYGDFSFLPASAIRIYCLHNSSLSDYCLVSYDEVNILLNVP